MVAINIDEIVEDLVKNALTKKTKEEQWQWIEAYAYTVTDEIGNEIENEAKRLLEERLNENKDS